MRWIWFFYKKKLKYLVKVFLKDMHSFSIREKNRNHDYANIVHFKRLTTGNKISPTSLESILCLHVSTSHITS